MQDYTWKSALCLAASVAMAYIFTTLNSLQGFVIFMTLIVLNKQVRTDFRRQVISNEVFLFLFY